MVRGIFLGLGALYLAIGSRLGWTGLPMIWLGANLLMVGIAYSVNDARLMGKRTNGTFHPLALLFYAPFLYASLWAWHLRRQRAEPAWHEVASGVYLGRMSTFAELPPGSPRVVDLTCELMPPRKVRGLDYRCLPTLDGCAPERAAFWALTEELARHQGPIFIHCAAGRGRSATLAAALLMKRGLAADPAAAVAMLKSKRSVVTLSDGQRRRLADAPQR